MSRIQHTDLTSIGLQNSIVGHLDMVNYFFPIRLNVLIVMGLGPAGGQAWLLWEAQSPTFGEGPGAQA